MKSCDFYSDEHKQYWCIVKKGEVSTSTYKDFCKCGETEKCPIYQHWKEERR